MHSTFPQTRLFYLLCICFIQITAQLTTNNSLSSTVATTTISYDNQSRWSRDFNLKIIATSIACLIVGIVLLRLCLLVCRSHRLRNHHLATAQHTDSVRSQISTIELHNFKPDLPPAYGEAIANIDCDESKLPSYDEVHHANTR